MNKINLSEWAIQHRALVVFFMILVTAAGISAYFHLGRNEDPAFTIKTMVVQAYLPGATMDETLHQLTERIEKKLQETPSLDYIKSYTLAGKTTIFVNLLTSVDKKDVPGIWYQVRKKIGDIGPDLPTGTAGPYFDDEFGDTYGIIYAFTSDGFTHREVKDYVESARDELLHVPDVAKIETLGAQDERVYIEFSTHQLAQLGIDCSTIIAALQYQNAITPSGSVDTGKDQVLVESTGKFGSDNDLKNVTFYAGQKKIRLGDIAEIKRGYSDPPQPRFRVNGKEAIGLAISMRTGGDILALENNISKKMHELHASMPIGIDAHLVADQPKVVHDAVNDFMEALIESVAIVLAISFLSLGMRAGAVVAISIPLVLAVVFVGMQIWGIDLQRVSLGALIIALGLLVDDAMITVESMVTKLEEGWTSVKAATFAYTSTAFPMLTGTLVTIIGFVPIGFAKSDAGEYTFSLFAVVAIALLVSWFVAVIFAPLIGVKLLKEQKEHETKKQGKVATFFRSLLLLSMRHSKITVSLTIGAFLLALAALPLVPQQFFPSSDRPELLVNMTLSQGSSIYASDVVSKKLDAVLKADAEVDHWSSYVGRGAIRFYLPLDEQLQNDFFSQTVVVTKSAEARERVRARLQKAFDENFPEAVTGIFALELGPPVGWPVQYRVSGKDPAVVRESAQKVAEIMATSQDIQKINYDWGETARKLRINVKQEEARQLGLNSASIAQTIHTMLSGATATQIRDSIYLVDVVLRAQKAERLSIENLRALNIPLPNGKSVSLDVVASVDYVQDFPLVWRRDRLPTLTVQADVKSANILPATVVDALQKKIDGLSHTLPDGYKITVGGTVEESAKSQASVMAVIPVMLLLMIAVLMIQLESFKHLALVLSVAPLGVIGVVGALLLTRQPLGFVALLGVVALIGMIVRNSVILVHQIEIEKEKGLSDWDAVVEATTLRFRPIMLTAVAAILGMVPIAPTVFWGPMANAIMGGLAVATVLTLIFLPSLYVTWFKIPAK
ncbi:TPA: ACR family transporter [Candidatus Sumerlaeota bacterium]|nr:ACR family transporter [Candidatus Sumerlaeota bacterium]